MNFEYFFSLGPLVGKVKDYQVEVIVDTLCNNMVSLRLVKYSQVLVELLCYCFLNFVSK